MNTRSLFFVLLSLVFGVGAVMLAQNWLKQSQPTSDHPDQAVVVTMSVSVPSGTVLEAKHLSLQAIPKALAPRDALTSIDQAVDKVAKFPMLQGDTLHPDKLALRGEGSVLASLIEPNKRAVTIRVNDVVGVAGFLLPGNRVDVLVTFKVGNVRNVAAETQTEVVLSNLKVLAVDQKANQDSSQPLVVRAVTLEVTLEQAESLMSARGKGTIQLALRNPTDDSEVSVAQASPEPQPGTPVTQPEAVPAKVAPRPPEQQKMKIEVIRGTAQQTVTVES
ncbi:Flp pilus assembly protein CpaB [Ferrimonas sp. SCSIO 43195]|uniref:Flp pilus assembly protein CpaB n=1 Tax=Ferrimonas sp. SCSIO 43195 TaxID=2822844 RepID=UPI002075E5F0|nr:Flp pilus assembly protein CpaB [Ferrimonas sp. SCSIO 43195]USD36508.1 Flp pilus assembly protein CpaB [Ferrimonas sp. SCSIO 43195]